MEFLNLTPDLTLVAVRRSQDIIFMNISRNAMAYSEDLLNLIIDFSSIPDSQSQQYGEVNQLGGIFGR